MPVAAIIPAAGTGTRLQSVLDEPKQFTRIAGKPLLAHTLLAFQACSLIDLIVIPTREDAVDMVRQEIVEPYGITAVEQIIPGGATRQESVWRGLQALEGAGVDIVAVHDAARMLVTPAIITRSVQAAETYGGCVVGLPAVDTIKMSHETWIEATVDRSVLWYAQTPQTFRYSLLCRAFRYAETVGFTGTDEAMLVEQLGERVALVRGSKYNFKVTDQEDLELARALLAFRAGKESR